MSAFAAGGGTTISHAAKYDFAWYMCCECAPSLWPYQASDHLRWCRSQTVQQLKQMISDEMGIEIRWQDLVYNGIIMLDSDRLWQYAVWTGCAIDLVVEEPYDLFARDPKTYKLSYKLSWTDLRLRMEIQDRIGWPPCHQLLSFCEKHLQNELLLTDYDVQPESTIHLRCRLLCD